MSQPSSPILTTKLFVPRSHGQLVMREALVAKLDDIPRRRLTLISASAGFGKSTLISSWIESRGFPSTWLSLENNDNDLYRFLTYLIASIQTLHPAVGESIRKTIEGSTSPPVDSLLTSLVNDLALVDESFALVLDDYHLITNPQIHDLLNFVLERAPRSFHLVLTTRIDPPFSLARLRVRGELLEVRASDLRFSTEDAAAFFSNLIGLTLSDEHLSVLQQKTEGWAAGLQLAALSLDGREDIRGFIEAFNGADRYVLDYLLEETLANLPEDLQRMMLEISILDNFNASICEVVTRCESGVELLATLERRNLFLIPLDNKRDWYRYHHLFADLLQHRLRKLYPESVKELYLRASIWSEEHSELFDPVTLARRGGDTDRMAELLERYWIDFITFWPTDDKEEVVAMIPQERASGSLRIGLIRAWLWMLKGRAGDTVKVIGEIEPLLPLNADDPDIDELTGHVILLRARVARYEGEPEKVIDYLEQALKLIPDRTPGMSGYCWMAAHGVLETLRGIAYQTEGNIASARDACQRALEIGRRSDDPYTLLIALTNLAQQHILLGNLGRALDYINESIEIFDRKDIMIPPTTHPFNLRAEILLERYDLDAASKDAETALTLAVRKPVPRVLEVNRMALQLELARGEWARAEERVAELEKLTVIEDGGRYRPVMEAMAAERYLKMGDIARASAWADRTGGKDSETNGVERNGAEVESALRQDYIPARLEEILRCRITIARDDLKTAAGMLAELRQEFRSREIVPYRIDVMVLQALLFQKEGENDEALDALAEALELGAPQGFIRPFAYTADPVARLLASLQRAGSSRTAKIPRSYLKKVSEACGLASAVEEAATRGVSGDDLAPLTSRELEILQLISIGLSNQKIANKLYVSINTVKTHTSNLFDKLGARSRIEAIQRAREANILKGQ